MSRMPPSSSRQDDPRIIVLDLLEAVLVRKRLLDESLDRDPRLGGGNTSLPG